MIEFNYTISWGEIFAGCSGLCAAAAFLFRKGGDIAKLNMAVENALTEISELKQEISKIGQILTQVAVQNERMDNMGQRQNLMDRRLDELRHGDGWVRGPKGIDKEY